MTNRILFNASAFKITKPGYDVLTETNIQNMIVDSTYPGMGMYTTGTVGVSAGTRVTVFYSNPTGQIPFVLVQAARTSDSIGGGFVRHTETTSYLEDTVPQTRVYSTVPVSGNCYGLDVYAATDRISVFNADTVTRTMRYCIFYPSQGSTTGGSYDMVPDALNWTNFSGSANPSTAFGGNSQSIAGLGGPITLRIRSNSTLTSNQSIRVKVNAGYAATISAGSSSVNITVQNGDVISFAYLGSAAYNDTVFVDNLSTSTNNIDSFVITATAIPDTTVETNWPNINVSTNTGGAGYVIGYSTATAGTINTSVSLTITLQSRLIAVDETCQVFVNGSQVAVMAWNQSTATFTVSQGQTVQFLHAKYAASTSATFWITNNTQGGTFVDSFTSVLTDTYVGAPDYTPDGFNINDISGESYFNNNLTTTSNTVSITGINQTVTLRLHLAANTPADITFSVIRNGSVIATIPGGSLYVDFTVVVNDTLAIRVQKTVVGTYNGVGYITNVNTSATHDSFNITATKNSGAP